MNIFKNEYQDSLDFEFGFNGHIKSKDKLEKKQKKQGNSGNFFSFEADNNKDKKDKATEDCPY